MEVEVLSAQTEKAELRLRFKKARREYASPRAAKALSDHLLRWLADYGGDRQVCLYYPLPEEAQFHLSPATAYYFPKLQGDDLLFVRPHDESTFASGPFGILEPTQGQPLKLDKPITVFCPAVAVDSQGGRLGMGKGYYDRFFVKHPHVQRVGVVYQVQVSESPLPAEEWDQPLDWIVTDKMILRTSQRSS